jgi:uncharacterized protein
MAVLNAQSKADELAGAGGVSLGKILSIQEDGGGWNSRPHLTRATATAASLPVEAGETTVSSAVVITYAIDN